MTTTAFALTPQILAREYGKGRSVPWAPGFADQPYLGTLEETFFTEHVLAAVNAIAA